ncbi:MAG: iron-sulfur cluster assembly protein [candidate division Zixibacteria bacterium]|nr:iron-sulfur cluster assembly protein [candidate division Zixibacteria bacterium]
MNLPSNESIREALNTVKDPEMNLGIVDLGLIYDICIEPEGKVVIRMTLTSPACPYGPTLLSQVHHVVDALEGVTDVEVKLAWDPVWDPKTMASDPAKDVLGIW